MPRFPARVISVAFAFWASMAVVAAAQKASDVEGPEPKNVINETPTRMADAPAPNANTAKVAPAQRPSHSSATNFLLDFTMDQEALWTSPARLRFKDTTWLVPLSGIAAGLFVTDSDVSRHLSHDPNTLSRYDNISTAGVAGLLGGSAAMWTFSHFNGNPHWRETGFLASEAAVHSLLMTEALKYSLRRERPYQGDGTGPFFQQGGTSFPSEHAAAAWSAASVIAHEYPGPLTKLLAYGAASLVSFSRVRAEKHFPSDVMVGALVGQLAAYEIYKRHHDPELGGDVWRSPSHLFFEDGRARPGFTGSPYVPLDSWVYPVFQRLMALGYLNSAMLGQRPWTRSECLRLVNEASEGAELRGGPSPDASQLLDSLRREFNPDDRLTDDGTNRAFRLESVYTRLTGISGQPLTDADHFAETLTNDFGRPYQEGFNAVSGVSGWATAGPWVAYVRGEYQAAPSGPAYSETVRNFIAQVDLNPVQPGSPISARSQFQLLDAYVGLSFNGWQLSYGQQSQWWGPGRSGAMLLSDNAAPIRMIQLNRVSPVKLPWIFRYLGPVRTDAFFGNLAGHQFPPNAFMHGEKISFKPTPNLEFGFSRTDILGGVGRPLTLTSLWNSYVSVTSPTVENPATDPGKRSGGFDFSYRVPFLRNWLTVYADSIADDDPSPLAAPRRAGINPGIYLPQLPGLKKLDLRVEAAYTDVPSSGTPPGHFIYFDSFFHDLYTNNQQLMGDWVGRDGKGIQAWSRYWFDPRTSLELSYRHDQVSSGFVPGGGNLNDASIAVSFLVRHSWSVSGFVQFERWLFPILQPGPQINVATSVQVQFQPQKIFRPSFHSSTNSAANQGDSN